MRHQNSVFHGVLKHVPWAEFDRLVEAHGADLRVRRLTTKSQFVALLYGQLSGATSLREIVGGLESHAARLYHLGARPAQRSTLADANAMRPSAVFSELFAQMVQRAHRGLRRRIAETTYLIDATGLRLSALCADWARFSAGVCGAKLHVIYDPDADRPIYAVVSAANVNDITIAQAMPIEPGATYVYDLGYYDYGWWAKLDAQGCRIVTRFKSNTPLAVVRELPVPRDGSILSDRVGYLPARQARSRQNPFQDPVREVRLKTATGKVLRLLSNDLDATAQGDRRPLQAALGHRAVLPLGQADPEDHPLPRHLRECHPHPDRRRLDRLPAAASRPGDTALQRQPARLRPPRPRQPHAQAAPRPPPPTPYPTAAQ